MSTPMKFIVTTPVPSGMNMNSDEVPIWDTNNPKTETSKHITTTLSKCKGEQCNDSQ
jgi:hypothetical protein